MMNHIVLIKLKESAVAQLSSIIASVDASLSKVPFGTRACVGPPISAQRAGGYHFGIYRAFQSMDEFKSYQKHPDHMSVVTGILGPQIEEMVVFQIDVPDAKL